jgi:hypothetical protein
MIAAGRVAKSLHYILEARLTPLTMDGVSVRAGTTTNQTGTFRCGRPCRTPSTVSAPERWPDVTFSFSTITDTLVSHAFERGRKLDA